MGARLSEEFSDGVYDTTEDLLALSHMERGLSITSSNDMELSRGSSRLDILLNPKFENFERFLRSLIELE
jgi:hypothetical protein